MTTRPQEHLADVVRRAGSGDATEELRNLLTKGLINLNAREKAERIVARGDNLKHNPSVSDAGKCPRQVVYSLMNVPESDPPTDDTLMNFLVGHAVEEAWAKILIAAGAEIMGHAVEEAWAKILTVAGAKIVREERVEIPAGDTKITGRIDFDGVRFLLHGSIVELKSTSSRAMSFLLKRGEPGRAEHRRQLALYLYASQQPSGYLVYLVKDATRGEPILHAYRVDLDENEALADITELAELAQMAKAGTAPPIPPDYKASAFPCSYCFHKTHCYGLKKQLLGIDQNKAKTPDKIESAER